MRSRKRLIAVWASRAGTRSPYGANSGRMMFWKGQWTSFPVAFLYECECVGGMKSALLRHLKRQHTVTRRSYFLRAVFPKTRLFDEWRAVSHSGTLGWHGRCVENRRECNLDVIGGREVNFFGCIGIFLLSVSFAVAQEPTYPGNKAKDLTNCPPSAAQNSTNDTASQNAQAVEKSAILPSAEGHEKSAAPTIQRNGQSVEARSDCPPDAKQPKG